MNKFTKVGLTFGVAVSILMGCSERDLEKLEVPEIESKETSSKMSQKLESQVLEYAGKWTEIFTFMYFEDGLKNSKYNKETENRLKQELTDFYNYSKTVNFAYENKFDDSMRDILFNYQYNTEMLTKYLLKLLNDRSDSNARMAISYSKDLAFYTDQLNLKLEESGINLTIISK